jgi:hypothetical protein
MPAVQSTFTKCFLEEVCICKLTAKNRRFFDLAAFYELLYYEFAERFCEARDAFLEVAKTPDHDIKSYRETREVLMCSHITLATLASKINKLVCGSTRRYRGRNRKTNHVEPCITEEDSVDFQTSEYIIPRKPRCDLEKARGLCDSLTAKCLDYAHEFEKIIYLH